MTHPAIGRIQKYPLRKAFDGKYYRSKITKRQILPDSVLYREKEQFADGVGRGWITELQTHASLLFPNSSVGAECALYESYQESPDVQQGLKGLIRTRQARRRQHARDGKVGMPGRPQSARWYPVGNDADLTKLNLSKEDAVHFLNRVLAWSRNDAQDFSPSLETLNGLVVDMLERVPFHNLTLLTRERRPPTMDEIKEDMMTGIGGPCAVVNSFFAVLLDRLGFGPHVYLLSCEINQRRDCHVAILLQLKGLRYFVDVANAKPYNQAVHLGDSSIFATGPADKFIWGLRYNDKSGLMEVHHSDETAISFHPSSTAPYSSFRTMIARSRSDTDFGPFLTGLRFVLYPYHNASHILAVRDACIHDGSDLMTWRKYCAATKESIRLIANRPPFARISGFKELADKAISCLDKEQPEWFERSRKLLHEKGVSEVESKEVCNTKYIFQE